MSWTAAVDYSSGQRNRSGGIPCQDYGRLVKPSDDLVIGAIADGAGSARFSHLGSRTAVAAALSHLEAQLVSSPVKRGDPTGGTDGAGAAELFDGILPTVSRALEQLAREQAAPMEDFATTLLAFVAGPTGVVSWQVGDCILIYRTSERNYALLGEPERGEYVNETVFVTSPDARASQRVSQYSGKIRFLCASTDGLIPVSIENRGNRPHANFFQPLDTFIGSSMDDRDAHRGIRSFLRSDRVAERVSDDVALMLCGWRAFGSA